MGCFRTPMYVRKCFLPSFLPPADRQTVDPMAPPCMRVLLFFAEGTLAPEGGRSVDPKLINQGVLYDSSF